MCEMDGRLVLRYRQRRIHLFCSYQVLLHCGLSCLFRQALHSVVHEIQDSTILAMWMLLSSHIGPLCDCVRICRNEHAVIRHALPRIEKMNGAHSPKLHIVCFHYHLGSRSSVSTVPGLGQPLHPPLLHHGMAAYNPKKGTKLMAKRLWVVGSSRSLPHLCLDTLGRGRQV